MKLNISVLDLLVGLIILASTGLIVAGVSYTPVGQDATVFYAATEAGGINQFFIDTGIYSKAIYYTTIAGGLTAENLGKSVEYQYNGTMSKIENSGHWDDEATKEMRRQLSMCILTTEYNGESYTFKLGEAYNLHDGDDEGKNLGYYPEPDKLTLENATVVASNSVAFTTITRNDVIFRVYYIVPK